MGSENGISVALEMKELFDELGLPDGQVTLIRMVRGESNFSKPTALAPMSMGNPILDDPGDREKYALLLSSDRRIFRIWGGALAPDEATLADGQIAEANIKAAMTPLGGGIGYGGKVLTIVDYQRDFSIEAAVMQWHVITESIRLVE